MTWAFTKGLRLGTPKVARHPLQTDGGFSRLHWFVFSTACRVARLPGGSDRGFPQPTETFTSELSNGSVALPAVGYNRLPRYYELLRHPKRPGLSLTSCQLIHLAITAGTSRVAYGPLCLHAVANTPAGLREICSLVHFHQLRPSPKSGRVGSCVSLFEACSAFTHVTACMLAESPMRPSTPKASAASLPPPLLRLLPGGANQFPGGFISRYGPPPFTAHPIPGLTAISH